MPLWYCTCIRIRNHDMTVWVSILYVWVCGGELCSDTVPVDLKSCSCSVWEEASGGMPRKAQQLCRIHRENLHPQEPLQPTDSNAYLCDQQRNSKVWRRVEDTCTQNLQLSCFFVCLCSCMGANRICLFFGFSVNRASGLLESSMLLNIQQPFSKAENTVLLAASPETVSFISSWKFQNGWF